MKSNYVLRWAGKPARDYLKSLPDSKFKYEGANADEMLTALERKTKPKSNEIAVFTKLHSLKEGDMPLSEFIQDARRLAELCNYPNDIENQATGKIRFCNMMDIVLESISELWNVNPEFGRASKFINHPNNLPDFTPDTQ